MARIKAWRWPIVLVALLALTAAACSSDDDGGGGGGLGPANQQDTGDDDNGEDGGDGDEASGGGRDGCELVTQADAEEILEEPVTRNEEGTDTPLVVAECSWQVDFDAGFKLLQFQLYEGEMFYGEDAFREGGDIEIETVDGVGDRAFFYGDPATSLQVLDGDMMVAVSASWLNMGDPETPLLDEATVKDQLIELARKVLSRL